MDFTVTRKCAGKRENVIDLITNGIDLPKYWHGIREIRENGSNRYYVKFQFPGRAEMEYSVDRDAGIFTENYLKGPFIGTKRTEVTLSGGETVITSVWTVNLSLMLRPMRKTIEKHFREGTENALRRLCSATLQSAAGETK